jgi:hypothetical protein
MARRRDLFRYRHQDLVRYSAEPETPFTVVMQRHTVPLRERPYQEYLLQAPGQMAFWVLEENLSRWEH